jgi:transcription antitermination factor NusG
MDRSLVENFRDDGSVQTAPSPYVVSDGESSAGWWACYTMSRSEKKVDALLRQRGCVSYLPMVDAVRRWSDRRKRVSMPLFPGYVFAQSEAHPLGEIMSTPGIAAVVRFGARPVLIPHDEIRNIARFAHAIAESGYRPSRVRLYEGQRVRVRSGPFEGVHGIVKEVRGRARVLVGLTSIGVGFEVDVGTEVLQALADA